MLTTHAWLVAALLAAPPAYRIEETVAIAPVWSGHPVRFSLLTHGDRQFVAFYDADRRMTVGSRRLGSKDWQLKALDSRVGWDSHNSLTLAVDADEHLHLAGNMHVNPLNYFRTTRPLDVMSFERVPHMVGDREERCTYPVFLDDADGRLLFTYRDGRSGDGEQVWNVYDPAGRSWGRLLDQPLFSGEGRRNAYFHGPVRGPDGRFHVVWMWRETPDCATNHSLCYARSADLVHWETSDGRPLALPITLETAEVVDPAPPGGGLLNPAQRLGFDLEGRPILSYLKYDERGHNQVYNARRESSGWVIHRASDWDYRWEFGGGGSIRAEIGIDGVHIEDGRLVQGYSHPKAGKGRWRLDPATLKPIGPAPPGPAMPRELGRVESSYPGMTVQTAPDSGTAPEPGVRYLLRWETLPPNRDRPRPGDPPPPNPLRLYTLRLTEAP